MMMVYRIKRRDAFLVRRFFSCRFIGLFLGGVLTACFLASCARSPDIFSQRPPQLSAPQYLRLADQTTGGAAVDYQLKAISLLLQQQQLNLAANYLQELTSVPLSPDLKSRYQLNQARLDLLMGRRKEAVGELSALRSSPAYSKLAVMQQYQLNKWQGEAYLQQGQLVQGLHWEDQALSFLPSSAVAQRQRLLLSTWQNLLKYNTPVLKGQLTQATDSITRGWLQLVILVKQPVSQSQFLMNLKHWQEQHKNHPALVFLNEKLQNKAPVIRGQLKKIAVILPVDGPYVSSAQAVRDGIMAAYYQYLRENKKSLNIDFIDIADGDVAGAYRQAVANNDQVVIGPLAKKNLAQLIKKDDITLPTIALNRVRDSVSPPLLYQFALSPDDEAQQIAIKAWQQGHHHALVIVPQGSWGRDVAGMFRQQWQRLGGRVVDQINYKSQSRLNKQLMYSLGIGQSYVRRDRLRRLVRQKLRFVARRRQDVDMVLVIASPRVARQIQPLLKYYYAGDLSMYAISMVYAGTPDVRRDEDLNGIIFCDLPWVLDRSSQLPPQIAAIRQRIKKNWPARFARKPRLFALGVDAFRLVNQLNRLNLLNHYSEMSATGYLSLTNQREIYRTLPTAVFIKGKPRLLS